MPDSYSLRKKVSIIIPAINEEKLIQRLLSQFNAEIKNRFDLEVIVSDGGSEDLTLEIAKKYADRLILHKEKYQQNISQGRNEGARYSLGDVLIFLNADTFVKDIEYVLNETMKEFLDKNVSAIACPIYVFPEEEKFSDKAFHFFYNNYAAMLNKFFMGMGRGECHIIRREKFFTVLSNGKNEGIKARTGLLKTSHSEIETPVFMPVGTAGTVKALEHRELDEFDTRIILGNTYHLFLRPGIAFFVQSQNTLI